MADAKTGAAQPSVPSWIGGASGANAGINAVQRLTRPYLLVSATRSLAAAKTQLAEIDAQIARAAGQVPANLVRDQTAAVAGQFFGRLE